MKFYNTSHAPYARKDRAKVRFFRESAKNQALILARFLRNAPAAAGGRILTAADRLP